MANNWTFYTHICTFLSRLKNLFLIFFFFVHPIFKWQFESWWLCVGQFGIHLEKIQAKCRPKPGGTNHGLWHEHHEIRIIVFELSVSCFSYTEHPRCPLQFSAGHPASICSAPQFIGLTTGWLIVSLTVLLLLKVFYLCIFRSGVLLTNHSRYYPPVPCHLLSSILCSMLNLSLHKTRTILQNWNELLTLCTETYISLSRCLNRNIN